MSAGKDETPPVPRGGREAIVVAAAELIAQRGVRGLRMEHVTRAAGVSRTLAYYHFDSTTALIRAALEYANDHAPSMTLLDAGPGTSGYDAIEAALIGELGSSDDSVHSNSIIWAEVTATAVFEEDLREDLRRVTAIWEEAVAAGIRRGIDDGSVRDDVDPARAATRLTVLVDGVCQRWLAGVIDTETARGLVIDSVADVLAPQ
jgi:AcrR family transcriptional regulator